MTIISSGQLALQNAGTNSSTTVANKLYDNTMTSGVDALLEIERKYELPGGDTFSIFDEWRGALYGFNSSFITESLAGNNIFNFLGQAGNGVPAGAFRGSSTSNIGTATTAFTDGGGTSRTIKGIMWGIPDGSPSPNQTSKWLIFALSGTGISDSDTTFKSIKITKPSGSQQTFTRSSASEYSSSTNASTAWAWEVESSGTTTIDNLGTSGSGWDIEIFGSDITTSLNNGIAEEMGGDDSSDVKMSDYYSPGTFIGSGLSGVPSSGQIKYSDFYGKAHIGFVTSAVEVQPAAKYSLIVSGRGHSYEAILHGFGQTYTNTYNTTIGNLNSGMASSIKTDSAQGSIISSPDLTLWGPAAGTIGTLRSITHFSTGATQSTDSVMMIVEGTGSNSNAGFTNLTATRTGMTTLTLARSSATYYYSSTNTARIWLWGNVDYTTGNAHSSVALHESTLFPGGAGSGSANTTTTDRSTWTIS
jgi:hypothetical protein